MSETIILDPEAVAEARTEVELTKFVNEAGPDYGDAAIEAYLAQAARGQLPVDFRIPNRIVTIPLLLTDWDGITFAEIRRRVQAKTALFQQQGGWLRRDTADGPAYADVIGATLKLGADTHAAFGHVDANAVLTLECLPDWYGDEVTLDAITETTNPEILAVLELAARQAQIRGDYPGRCRIVIDELQHRDQLGALWAMRARHYDSAATAQLAYDSAALTLAPGSSTLPGFTGASGAGSVIEHPSLTASWTPILTTDLAGGPMTHVGSYRVIARVRCGVGAAASIRLAWGIGDLTSASFNSEWVFPEAGKFFLADLGEIRLDRAPVGTHQWIGQLQGMVTATSPVVGGVPDPAVDCDRLWLVPLDDTAGRASAPAIGAALSDLVGFDDFATETAAALAGQAARAGGNWSGAGDTDDFFIETTPDAHARRSAVSDSSLENGRYARLGTGTGSAMTIRANLNIPVRTDAGEVLRDGVFLRYTDTSNWLMACYEADTGGFTSYRVKLYKRVAGTTTMIAQTAAFTRPTPSRAPGSTTDFWCQLILTAQANGTVTVSDARGIAQSSGAVTSPTLRLSTTDDDVAAGGALASGGYGIYDAYIIAADRNSDSVHWSMFDNVSVVENAAPDAVVYADGTAELRTEGLFRETHAADGVYGPVTRRLGDLPRIPPSGLEGRPVELLVKLSRGDLDQLADQGIDDVRVQVVYRPSFLFIPEV